MDILTVNQIIDETLGHYVGHYERFGKEYKEKDWRAGSCAFLATNGSMCAVGRCALDVKDDVWKCNGLIKAMFGNNNDAIRSHLKPQYRIPTVDFWLQLQILHDSYIYWNEDATLTKLGQQQVARMREEFN